MFWRVCIGSVDNNSYTPLLAAWLPTYCTDQVPVPPDHENDVLWASHPVIHLATSSTVLFDEPSGVNNLIWNGAVNPSGFKCSAGPVVARTLRCGMAANAS